MFTMRYDFYLLIFLIYNNILTNGFFNFTNVQNSVLYINNWNQIDTLSAVSPLSKNSKLS